MSRISSNLLQTVSRGFYTSSKLRTELTEKGERQNIKNEPAMPEEPKYCCMSGCANCVWIKYAQEMAQSFEDGDVRAKQKITEKVHDPQLRAFLFTQLGLNNTDAAWSGVDVEVAIFELCKSFPCCRLTYDTFSIHVANGPSCFDSFLTAMKSKEESWRHIIIIEIVIIGGLNGEAIKLADNELDTVLITKIPPFGVYISNSHENLIFAG